MNYRSTTLTLAAMLLPLLASAATVQVTVLARDGQPLADAVVVLVPTTAAPAGRSPAPQTATVQQQRMQFVPALTVVPVGSRLRFTNMDAYEHHVRGRPAGMAGLNADAGSGFELRLDARQGEREPTSAEVTLNQPGPLQLGCHLHGSMRGHVFVADSPWTVKTGPDGVATLQDVPEGAAHLRVWHGDQLIEAAPLAVTVAPVTVLRVPSAAQPRRRRP